MFKDYDEGAVMINDMLVVDATVHAANATRDNIAEQIRPMTEPFLEAIYGLHAMLSPASHRLEPSEPCAIGAGGARAGAVP